MRIVACLILSSRLVLAAPDIDPVKAGMDTARLKRMTERIKAFSDQGTVAGTVVLVARHGTIAAFEASGWQDIEARKPMRPDSIFQVMSMTKPVTAVAIQMLVEDGKVRVGDPVEKYLPEFRGQWMVESKTGTSMVLKRPTRAVTVRDLLTHTSCMVGPGPALAQLYQKMDRPLGEAVAVFAQLPLDCEPGSRWLYSNTGIATLGRIVEVAGDQPFEAFVASRIFEPLGMKDSFFFPDRATPGQRERIAAVYRSEKGALLKAGDDILGGNALAHRKGARYSAPEFGLYSTAADLLRFYDLMRAGGVHGGKRLLSRASVELMTSLHTGDLPKAGWWEGNPGFGLGWEVVRDAAGGLSLLSPGTFHHGGAFGTHGWIDPRKDLVGVFLVQQADGRADEVKKAFMAMAVAAITD
ncbi:MAG: serine hydrolase domain-containing protein [Bryobacteraceae bacterium]|nr:serine hydrolase domain-containing protein [Bryobacteraceae bacterium]